MRIMPWVNSRLNGSRSVGGRHAEVGQRLGEEAGVHQVQDGVLDAADVLVDRHPVRGRVRVERHVGRSTGRQKRRKYHDESTKVSMVSVSRAAGPPQIGQVVCRKPSWSCSGDSPVGRNSTSSGASTGSWSSGTGTMPCVGAVDDRDRAAPEALARQQPVAQAVVDRAPRRCPAPRASRWPWRLAVGLAEPVEPLAVDGRARRPCTPRPPSPSGGCTVRTIGQVVGLGEVPVALVLAGHGHDRPGAVAHQHVVGEVDRHRLAR